MNEKAERHLAKAEGYLGKGEAWYRKAAEEIVAAKEADFTLSNKQAGEALKPKRSERWVRDLVAWVTSSERAPTLYGGQDYADKQAANHTKRILREAPLEQVEQMLAELSPERQKAIAAAAGDQYQKARLDFEEEERRMTPSERKQREAAADAITDAGRRAAGGFASLGIGGHLEQAKEDLSELVADHAVTAQTIELIEPMHRAWCEEWEVALAMAGLETDRERV